MTNLKATDVRRSVRMIFMRPPTSSPSRKKVESDRNVIPRHMDTTFRM